MGEATTDNGATLDAYGSNDNHFSLPPYVASQARPPSAAAVLRDPLHMDQEAMRVMSPSIELDVATFPVHALDYHEEVETTDAAPHEGEEQVETEEHASDAQVPLEAEAALPVDAPLEYVVEGLSAHSPESVV